MTLFIPAQGLPLSSKAYSNTIGSSAHSGQNLNLQVHLHFCDLRTRFDLLVKEASVFHFSFVSISSRSNFYLKM